MTGAIPGEGSDHSTAMGLVAAFASGVEETEKYFQWLKARTEGLVNNPLRWHQIDQLAKALLEHERLGARKVREVIREAGEEWTESQGGKDSI